MMVEGFTMVQATSNRVASAWTTASALTFDAAAGTEPGGTHAARVPRSRAP